MKLHRYLEQLLGNKVSISVLRTLVQYKGKIFTIRRLAHDADVSHPGVSKTVGELEKFGIVQIQPVGRSHQVSLNEKSHVLKKIIEPMFMAEKQTIDQVILILKRHLSTKKIISSVVFGSV
jgi:DNA-binding transcriptional regulator YhcF (GntR family)